VSDQINTEVRGNALYLEFHREASTATFQLLVHPDGVSADHKYVSFGMFYRTLNQSYPKRPWSTAHVNTTSVNRAITPDGKLDVPVVTHDILSTTELFQNHVASIFGQLTRQGYTLFKQPVVVEVSNIDLNEIAMKNTPYALMRRVMSARKALGFPEDLVATPTPTPSR
jgi:hypothetical protein